jgi:hypothetical protein
MKIKTILYVLALLGLSLALGVLPADASPTAVQPDPAPPAGTPDAASRGPTVGEPVVPAVFDGDLRSLPQLEPGESPPRDIPLLPIPGRERPTPPATWMDPVAQTGQGTEQMPDPTITFPGLQGIDAGNWVPPDTNGDVGVTHYVQTVNVGIGMYDKATGAELVKISFNDFFDGTGTLCDYSNRGDPIALYDPLAGRWVISDFGWIGSSGPYYQCIAVSQSEDPVSGGWYFYALPADPSDPNRLNDYPKWGVWPDAYYMSANMYYGSIWGARVWALDREAMVNGEPMNWVAFDLGSSYWSLLPSNLRGDPPPPDTPNYFASVDPPNTLRLWEFHVDWENPGNSHLDGPTTIPVAPYTEISQIPQPPPGESVDSLGDRLMMQLQYRNFGTHESLWVNHTVYSGGVASIRWYELRDPGGTPSLYQQGTYQPADGIYRWMGSLAVDKDGNMALGYSASSTSLFPAIRYAGRLVDDPLGTLPQSEASLFEGSGVQLNGAHRWGDYSAMTVDPVDDCTFWYTNEYYAVNSDRNWQTRIGSFRFPSCTAEPRIFVGNIKTKYRVLDPGPPTIYKVLGRAPIYDEELHPIIGATVTAQWELPGGQIKIKTATTRPNASAYFKQASPQEGLYVVTVLDVQAEGYVYDPNMNFETSEDLLVP